MAKKPKPSDVDKLIRKMTALGQSRGKRTAGPHLGFDSAKEAELFTAIARSHPKGVAIDDERWKRLADTLTNRGYFRVVIGAQGYTYRLTPSGVKHAINEGFIEQ